MAVYTPKNSKDVEAIKLPLNYTRSDLEAVSRWLARNAPNTTFVGEGRSDGSFQLVIRTIFSSIEVEPSSYIIFDPKTTQLRQVSAELFEEDYDPKFTSGLIASGSIHSSALKGHPVTMPPGSMYSGL